MVERVNTGGNVSFVYEQKGDNSEIHYSPLANKLRKQARSRRKIRKIVSLVIFILLAGLVIYLSLKRYS